MPQSTIPANKQASSRSDESAAHTTPTRALPGTTTAVTAQQPLKVDVVNASDAPNPGWTIASALIIAIIGAYIAQRFAHRYAIDRQRSDRQEARRDRRQDDGRRTLDVALQEIASERKRLGALQGTTWVRRQFFRDELSDSQQTDVDRLNRGRQTYYADQQVSIDSGRVVAALRPRLALYFNEGGALLAAFDQLSATWVSAAHAILAVDEETTTKEIAEDVAAAFAEIDTAVRAFGEAAASSSAASPPARL